MFVYIITFQDAYEMRIEAAYTSKGKAEEHIAKLDKFYNYEIIEIFAE